MTKRFFLVELQPEKPIDNLIDVIGGRLWSIDKVKYGSVKVSDAQLAGHALSSLDEPNESLTDQQATALLAMKAIIEERLLRNAGNHMEGKYPELPRAEEQLSAQGQGDSVTPMVFTGYLQTVGNPIQQAELSADAIARMAKELTKDMASTQPGFMDQFAPAVETI